MFQVAYYVPQVYNRRETVLVGCHPDRYQQLLSEHYAFVLVRFGGRRVCLCSSALPDLIHQATMCVR
jgi:hypothetical protein